jgi:hypothetical protein
MCLFGYGFKKVKAAKTMLSSTFVTSPYRTPLQFHHSPAMANAISFSVSCICYSANHEMIKGSADEVYLKLLANLQRLGDDYCLSLLPNIMLV